MIRGPGEQAAVEALERFSRSDPTAGALLCSRIPTPRDAAPSFTNAPVSSALAILHASLKRPD
jgi:hypothetical protein